jgi:hypothetical protein
VLGGGAADALGAEQVEVGDVEQLVGVWPSAGKIAKPVPAETAPR